MPAPTPCTDIFPICLLPFFMTKCYIANSSLKNALNSDICFRRGRTYLAQQKNHTTNMTGSKQQYFARTADRA